GRKKGRSRNDNGEEEGELRSSRRQTTSLGRLGLSDALLRRVQKERYALIADIKIPMS
ncbi:hypothetical protein CSUI_009434, partial [Cystoisospora suis]